MLLSLAIVGLKVAAAEFAMVNAQTRLPFHKQACQAVTIRVLAERTSSSPEPPGRAATTAAQKPKASRILANQLPHRGKRTTRGTITTQPVLLIPPLGKGDDHRGQQARP